MSIGRARDWTLAVATWLILGGWLGSWSLFAFEVAPTAFQVLHTQGLAGDLVGPVLATLHNYGIFAGLTLAGIATVQRRGWLAIVLPVTLAAFCAYSEYAITPEINEVQPLSFGPELQEQAARRFSELHQRSRTLYGLVGLGVIGLVVVHARPRQPAT